MTTVLPLWPVDSLWTIAPSVTISKMYIIQICNYAYDLVNVGGGSAPKSHVNKTRLNKRPALHLNVPDKFECLLMDISLHIN